MTSGSADASLTLSLHDARRHFETSDTVMDDPFVRLVVNTDGKPGHFIAVAVCNMLEYRHGMSPEDMLQIEFIPGKFNTVRDALRVMLFHIFASVDRIRQWELAKREAGEHQFAASETEGYADHAPLPPLDVVLPPNGTETEWFAQYDKWAYAFVWTGAVRFVPN